jgi:hypothetical protein
MTLSVMSDSLSLQSSRSMFGVLLMKLRSWIWIGHDYITIMIIVLLTFDIDMGQRSVCLCLF